MIESINMKAHGKQKRIIINSFAVMDLSRLHIIYSPLVSEVSHMPRS